MEHLMRTSGALVVPGAVVENHWASYSYEVTLRKDNYNIVVLSISFV